MALQRMVLAPIAMRDFWQKRKRRWTADQPSPTDFDLLNRLKPLSFLSPIALRDLASGLNSTDFRRREVMVPEEALAAGVHVLLKVACTPTSRHS